jgi:chemotaxis protein histidine kinase CheA
MDKSARTFNQLTQIFKIFQDRKLSPHHPLIRALVRYEDIINELAETRDDLQYAKDKDDMEEEVEDLKEVIQELERMKKKQWSHMMESFIKDAYYYDYI